MSDHSFEVADAIKYGVEPAIIIKNLRFWLAKNVANGRHQYDGHYWTYNSAKAFAELFPYWTSNKLQKLLKRMEDDGIILSGVYNERGYDRTKWYTLPEFAIDLVEKSRHAIQPNGGMEKAKRLNGSSQTAEPIPDVNPDKKPDEDQELLGASAPADDGFETAWKAYPKREGANPKNKAHSAWKARLKEGVTAEAMMAGVARYAAYCQAKGNTGTEYVMQAQRFFGKGREFDNEWTAATAKPSRHHGFDQRDYYDGLIPREDGTHAF